MTKADIAALKADLIKWMFGGMVTGIFAAIVYGSGRLVPLPMG